MNKIGVVNAGDCSPISNQSIIKDSDSKKWEHLFVCNGGWHNMLLGERLLRKLFFPTVQRDGIYTTWRPTEAQKHWFFHPGDSTDAVKERNMVFLAMIEEAARYAEKDRSTSISASYVVKYMLEIAETCPIWMAKIIEL